MNEFGECIGAQTLRFVRHFNAPSERIWKPRYDARFADAV